MRAGMTESPVNSLPAVLWLLALPIIAVEAVLTRHGTVVGPFMSELVGHADLAGLEVIRMPAGSNPSYVTPAQLEVLVGMREELGRAG